MNEAVTTIMATAPASVALLGEHAASAEQAALAVSMGLYATCTLRTEGPDHPAADGYRIESNGQVALVSFEELMDLGRNVDALRAAGDGDALQRQVVQDGLIPTKYLLAAPGGELPDTLDVRIETSIPPTVGLGREGAIAVALATCLARLQGRASDRQQIAAWAERAGSVLHDDRAAGLATAASLYGGAIRYTAANGGEPIPCAEGLTIIIGHTDDAPPIRNINERISARLADESKRDHHLQERAALSRQGEAALRAGDWPRLGQLLIRNQALLEQLGVSHSTLARLIAAALHAGAYGATISASVNGGIVALAAPENADAVTEGIAQAGGEAIAAPAGAPGVALKEAPGTIVER
ncbi:MAG: mevalonate kinase family protein [Thermomicrobiales bacterium]